MSETFQGNLGTYQLTPTPDGGFTVFSEYFQEHCHSLEGAKTETKKIYLENSELLSEAQRGGSLRLLEVGAGLGLGLSMTLEALADKLIKGQVQLSYLGLELDQELFTRGILMHPRLEKMLWTKQNIHGLNVLMGTDVGVSAMILLGDARSTLPHFHAQFPEIRFGHIYQDPFSPKKNPQLWTVEWFTFLKKLSLPKVTLSTYSSSSAVRKAMDLSGWKIFEGGGLSKKRSSTVAKLSGSTSPEILDHLARSPVSALRDGDLKPDAPDSAPAL